MGGELLVLLFNGTKMNVHFSGIGTLGPGMPEKYDGRKGANGAGEESSYGDNVREGGGGAGSDFTFIIAVNDSGMGIGNGGAHDGGRDGRSGGMVM